MDGSSFRRNQYDLCCRPLQMYLSRPDKPRESVSQKAIRDQINAQREALNELSWRLQNLLNRNRPFDFCITLAVYLLNQGWPESIQQQSKNFNSEICRPDVENEAVVIKLRIDDTENRGKHLRAIFSQITCHIIQCPRPFALSNDFGPMFLYRFQNNKSATTYDCDVGFICGMWRNKPNFMEPTKSQFRKHMNGIPPLSPYISLMESPSRLYNFYRYKQTELWNAEIALVGARKLLQVGLKIARSTDIATYLNVDTSGTKYITNTHWLAQWLIPSHCIIKVISPDVFKKACRIYRILDG
jgi:hypothetical protein